MNRFDDLYKQLFTSYSLKEAAEDLPSPLTGNMAGGGPQGDLSAPSANAPQSNNLPLEPNNAIAPEDNIEQDDDDTTALISGKKIQLIKLISLSFISNGLFSSSAESNIRESELREIKMALNNPTTIGNVEKTEKTIIKAIAKLQKTEPFEIAKNIDFVASSSNGEVSSKYISNTEYTQLVELARKALISDPNKTGSNDKFGIDSIEDINSSNAEESLSKLKSILGGEVV